MKPNAEGRMRSAEFEEAGARKRLETFSCAVTIKRLKCSLQVGLPLTPFLSHRMGRVAFRPGEGVLRGPVRGSVKIPKRHHSSPWQLAP